MKKKLILLAVGAIVAGLTVWGFLQGHKQQAEERERERPVKAASRVMAQDGGTAVVLDAATQKRADIGVAPVHEMSRRGEIEAIASVLAAQELIDLRSGYIAARAQADKAKAALQASHGEYERVKELHNDEQNLSLKALEAAQAQWRIDEAAARGAGEAVDAVEQSARQKWGGVLAAAAIADAPLFRRLGGQREVLLRVAVPSGAGMTKAPAKLQVAANDGSLKTARLVSPSPLADPRVQGATFFYSARADGLLPGTTLTAYLPSGAQQAGAIVPAAAVVWWQGKAWVYVQTGPGRYLRRELAGAVAVEQGWFAPGAFRGAQVVVRGAQTLLSEELRSQIQVGEEGEGSE